MLICTDGGAILAILVDTLGWRMNVLLLLLLLPMMMICRFFDALSRLNVLLLLSILSTGLFSRSNSLPCCC
jgi:hypothetical protein